MNDELRPSETTGVVSSVEFVDDEDTKERRPGTYVTIRIDDAEIRWSAGRVAVRYLAERAPLPSVTEMRGILKSARD